MIGRMCKVGDGLSRPVLIARETFSKRRIKPIAIKSYRLCSLEIFSQVIYCRGYSGEEPPLPIPNREVKLTIADGTATPGGRVGSCRSSTSRLEKSSRDVLFIYGSTVYPDFLFSVRECILSFKYSCCSCLSLLKTGIIS